VVAAVPRIAAAYDEPFGNASTVPALHCARMARAEGVTSLQAGDGGDELFAGNRRYANQMRYQRYLELPAAVRGLLEPLALAGALGARARRYVDRARLPLPARLEFGNRYRGLDSSDCFAAEAVVDPDHPFVVMEEVYRRTRSASHLNRMMHLDLQLVLADDDLRKVRRTADLAGVDVRFPMLDEELVGFATGIAPGLLLEGRDLRRFFKRALAHVLPRSTLAKQKHGFGLPFGVWLRSHPPLAELAYDSLAALRRRGLLAPAFLDRVVAEHRGGEGSYNAEVVWVLMMLEQWFEAEAAQARAPEIRPVARAS
jgi:asparagine synthase (glutamine-hydrolysing)